MKVRVVQRIESLNYPTSIQFASANASAMSYITSQYDQCEACALHRLEIAKHYDFSLAVAIAKFLLGAFELD